MTSELVYHVKVSELHSFDWGVRELHIKAYCMKKGVNDKVRCFYDYTDKKVYTATPGSDVQYPLPTWE